MWLLGVQDDGSSLLTRLLRFSGVILVALLVHAFRKGYRVRKKFQALKDQGIPIMKHSMILGHLEVIGKLVSTLPSDAHGDYLMLRIQENWQELFPQCTKCPPVAYVDTWPFTAPMVISLNAHVSAQFTQEHSLPKAYEQKHVLYPLTKNRDLASMEGAEWKIWRKRLSPAFSIQNINSRLPDILEEVEDFANVLKSKAGKDGEWGEVFPLGDATANLTLDVIIRLFLNIRIHEQWGRSSPVCAALLDSISRLYFFVNPANFIQYYNPWRHFKLWQNYRTLVKSFTPALQERMNKLQQDRTAKGKTLVDLIVQALDAERAEQKGPGQGSKDQSNMQLDADFLEMAIGQINTFLFAGFDITAATIAWLFRLLSEYPEVLAKLREEHDAVLGPNAWGVADVIRENPQLLGQLPYTLAVLRESMRYHTNVGSMRRGEPGFFLVGPPGSDPGFEGKKLPTEDFIVWDGSYAIHRDPEIWHRAWEFLPERFLVTDPEDPLYPPPNGWRSFEAGPRVCIGQHLATVEIKLAMVLIARCFDVECAWEEWDQVK
ncbi:sterigmatocystin monooxygenase [Fusarium mexicanum]|uniref:Sterigmatocystin monooxygenase n=1 Tax=Fusarium mexicanum TaxID=751941 RepID=A0A8H5N9W3_9HYPO|nr:sterigmatocystin monooxygenase [Fusarium mexicanum]